MPRAGDPVNALYGLAPDAPRVKAQSTSGEQSSNNLGGSSNSNGNANGGANPEIHVHVHNQIQHEKHNGASTVHHQDDRVYNDNRSYTTTTAGKDHSAAISKLQGQFSELGRHVGGIARRQVGMDENAPVNVRTSVIRQPYVPDNAVPGSVIPDEHAPKVGPPAEHPSVSDEGPMRQMQNRNPNLQGLQFGNVGEESGQYRM